MNALAKAEALIFSAAYDIYRQHLPIQLSAPVLHEVLALYPLSQKEIRDRLEWYITDFTLSRSFYDLDKHSAYWGYDLLATLLDYETTNNCPCPNIFDLEPKQTFSFKPEIASLLPYYIKKSKSSI